MDIGMGACREGGIFVFLGEFVLQFSCRSVDPCRG